MRRFKVYHHPTLGYEAVKVGFSWPAFSFMWFWMLAKKLWGLGGLFVALFLVVRLMEKVTDRAESDPVLQISMYVVLMVCYFAMPLVAGLKGNDWRSANLERRGYELQQSIEAETPDAAVSRLVRTGRKETVLARAESRDTRNRADEAKGPRQPEFAMENAWEPEPNRIEPDGSVGEDDEKVESPGHVSAVGAGKIPSVPSPCYTEQWSTCASPDQPIPAVYHVGDQLLEARRDDGQSRCLECKAAVFIEHGRPYPRCGHCGSPL